MLKIVRLAEKVSDWIGVLTGIVVVYTIFIIVFNVIARYVFRAAPGWGFDAMVLPIGCAYALAGAYALRHQAHVNVDVITAALGQRTQAMIRVFTYPLLFLFTGALVWAGYGWAMRSYMIGETSGGVGWQLYPFKAMLPLGALLFLILGVLYMLRDIWFVVTGDQRYAPPTAGEPTDG